MIFSNHYFKLLNKKKIDRVYQVLLSLKKH